MTSNDDDKQPIGNMDGIIAELRALGFVTQAELTLIQIPNADRILYEGIKWYLSNRDEQFRPVKYIDSEGVERSPYREVADWLSDNRGRGLLLYGSCGLGKSMLACYVLPMILLKYVTPGLIFHVYTATELNNPDKLKEALGYHNLVIDDVGVEEQMISYGQRHNVFDEIMDAVEKKGKTIIATTNLNAHDLEQRYGTRTLDRIMATMKRVRFELRDANNNSISLRRYD